MVFSVVDLTLTTSFTSPVVGSLSLNLKSCAIVKDGISFTVVFCNWRTCFVGIKAV